MVNESRAVPRAGILGDDVGGRGVAPRLHVTLAVSAGLFGAAQRHVVRARRPGLLAPSPGFVRAGPVGPAGPAAGLAPEGPHGRVPRREDQEDEQSLQGGGDGEQVLEHHAGVLDGEESEHPAETWKRSVMVVVVVVVVVGVEVGGGGGAAAAVVVAAAAAIVVAAVAVWHTFTF